LVATKGGREKEKKRKERPRKVVCRHKKGDMRKEEKKRKRPRQARRWLLQRQGSVCPTPRNPFFDSRVFWLGRGPSWLKYRLLRDLVYEEAMCKGSSGNRLLYAAKAIPLKDYYTQVEDPAAKHS
jgi:hypothetical protein